MPFFVYLLLSADNKNTYVGASVDVDHRLRQHNGELVGGAKATHAKLGVGKWRRVMFISEFPTWQSALQFEWRWKQITRKTVTVGKVGCVHRRLIALKKLLGLEQSTSKAMPYSEWPLQPKINFEADMVAEFEVLFLGLE